MCRDKVGGAAPCRLHYMHNKMYAPFLFEPHRTRAKQTSLLSSHRVFATRRLFNELKFIYKKKDGIVPLSISVSINEFNDE